MTYTEPNTDPFPQATTPAEWLEIAYDNGWMRRNSSTANRGYMANFREDHREPECTDTCRVATSDQARWPYNPSSHRYLGPVEVGSELFQHLMREELPTLSPRLGPIEEEAA